MKFVPVEEVTFDRTEMELVRYLLSTVPDVKSWNYQDMVSLALDKFSPGSTTDLNLISESRKFAYKCLSIGIGDTDTYLA